VAVAGAVAKKSKLLIFMQSPRVTWAVNARISELPEATFRFDDLLIVLVNLGNGEEWIFFVKDHQNNDCKSSAASSRSSIKP
jgi:hypothetical protein